MYITLNSSQSYLITVKFCKEVKKNIIKTVSGLEPEFSKIESYNDGETDKAITRIKK